MKNLDKSLIFGWRIGLACLLAAVPLARSSTIWNGPNIGFYHTDANGLADQLTPGVALTRSSSGGGLYNAVTEAGATPGISPRDTAWAIGTLANFNTLTYGPCPLEAGHAPPGFVGTTFVVHLINEDIYFQLTLTNWGGAFGTPNKTFGYTRSTPAASPPSVSITNPVSGAVFAAPASLKLGASVGGGTVTNVEFFANATTLGSITTAPFNLTSGPMAAGAYSLTAVATASGLSTTSAVVNVTVINPSAINLSGSGINGGQLSFDYTADVGLTYFVQSSSDLASWVSLVTNTAASSPVSFSAPLDPSGKKFYRVGRLPNP